MLIELVGTAMFGLTETWWRHQMETFPRYWPFVRGIHRSLVDSLHKGQWHGTLSFTLICSSTNGWANSGDSGDFRRHPGHYDITVMRNQEIAVRAHEQHFLADYSWGSWLCYDLIAHMLRMVTTFSFLPGLDTIPVRQNYVLFKITSIFISHRRRIEFI